MNLIDKLKKMPIRRFDFDYEWYRKNKKLGYQKVSRINVIKSDYRHAEELTSCSREGLLNRNYYYEETDKSVVNNSGEYSIKKKSFVFTKEVFLRESLVVDLKKIDYRLEKFRLRLFISSGYRNEKMQKMAIQRIARQKRGPDAKPVDELFSNPRDYSPHTTGGAVDLEIWDLREKKLLLTKLKDRERIDLFYLENKNNLSLEEMRVRDNRRLLHNLLVSEEILGKNHFIHHPSEYWHYGRHERLASFLSGGTHPVYYDSLNLD